MHNHYYDNTHPLRPYTHSLAAMPGTVAPSNALRGDEKPTAKPGFWPGEQGGEWADIEDHRGEEGYVNGEPYTIADFGPYPAGWSKIPPAPTLDEARADKYRQIIAGSNAIVALVRSGYSDIEAATWNSQEAGAMAILAKAAAESGNEGAIAIFAVPEALALAVGQVNSLAEKDGVTPKEFALRIWNNARKANALVQATWAQQREYEHQLKEAASLGQGETEAEAVARVLALDIAYTTPQ